MVLTYLGKVNPRPRCWSKFGVALRDACDKHGAATAAYPAPMSEAAGDAGGTSAAGTAGAAAAAALIELIPAMPFGAPATNATIPRELVGEIERRTIMLESEYGGRNLVSSRGGASRPTLPAQPQAAHASHDAGEGADAAATAKTSQADASQA